MAYSQRRVHAIGTRAVERALKPRHGVLWWIAWVVIVLGPGFVMAIVNAGQDHG